MNNEDFFDILGNLDDDIISEATFTKKQKKQGSLIKIITFSAAVFAFILMGLLIKNSPLNTDYSLHTEKPASEGEISSFTEIHTDETTTHNSVISSTEENTSTEEITSASPLPTQEQTQNEEPSSIISEPSAEENTTAPEAPSDEIRFIDTDILSLISFSTDTVVSGYPVSEKTDIFTLQNIYGTRIIPSYLPTASTDSAINNIENNYTVYYNNDKTEVFCKNRFTYLLKGGNVLTVTASTEKISLLETEKENMSAVSYISDVPVLLFRGTGNGFTSIYSAYFQKDGCYFRIQLKGISPDGDEFIKIITSMI